MIIIIMSEIIGNKYDFEEFIRCIDNFSPDNKDLIKYMKKKYKIVKRQIDKLFKKYNELINNY